LVFPPVTAKLGVVDNL